MFNEVGQATWLPTTVPKVAESEYILMQFQWFYEQQEQQILMMQAQQQAARHQNDANLVFKVVRDQGPVPVEVLTSVATTQVVEVVDESSVVVRNTDGFTMHILF